MKFVKFLENQFQELRWEEGKRAPDAFDIKLDSEIKATHSVLNGYRKFVGWVMIPKVIGTFLMVNLKLIKEPEPVLINKLKEQKEAEMLAKSAIQPVEKESEGDLH